MLIYIHGFNSSPASFKARLLIKYTARLGLSENLLVPQLPFDPATAMEHLLEVVRGQLRNCDEDEQLSLIGSSLGGYYATWLAEKFDTRAVLINPAVRPYELFTEYMGTNLNLYTGEKNQLRREHLDQLRSFEVDSITKPDRYLMLLQTGDEVLDYHQALEKYAVVPMIVEEGGDHSFTGFDRHLETVLAFSGINCLKSYS